MTNRTTEMAKDQLAADIGAVIADAEELLHATASQAGDKAVAARTRIQASLKAARQRMTDLEMAAMCMITHGPQSASPPLPAPWSES